MDRTYIIKKYDLPANDIVKDMDKFYSVFEKAEKTGYKGIESMIFDEPPGPRYTEYCNSVRPFDDLFFDIMQWKFERF